MSARDLEVLVVIPARGGSKGVPKKNLRPLVGRPLIGYAIDAARSCHGGRARVIVTTDDEEISYFAGRLGAEVVTRSPELAADHVSLDPVVAHALGEAERGRATPFEVVVTLQCTSPLVAPEDLDEAIRRIAEDQADTVISVVEDIHLRWCLEDGRPVPTYAERRNRQQLPREFRETGAVLASRRALVRTEGRIGGRISLLEQPPERAVDIDRYEDWWVVERLLKRRRVLFVVTGNVEVGLGHAHRTLALAHELVHHDVAFLCTADSALAHQVVSSHHFPSTLAPDRDLAAVVLREKPHLVVNDILDTDLGYVRKLKDAGLAVVNFEDAGPGAAEADLVINALYDEVRWPHVRTGIDYACLRDEFIHLPRSRESIAPEPRELLIAFGGTDEGNLTVRVLRAVAGNAHRRGMHVSVVTGPGYLHLTALVELAAELSEGLVELAHDTRCISLYMARADLAICSGGRTTLELASLAVPTIVLCQNERETTHIFAGAEQGFVNLGLHTRVPTEAIRKAFDELAGSHARRQDLSARMRALPLLKGKQRVVRLLLEQLEDDGSVS